MVNTKLFTLITLSVLFSPNILHGWAHYAVVLHDPKTGHLVRLLGDRHWCGNKEEKTCQNNFEQYARSCFDDYLNNNNPDICIVEGSGMYDSYHERGFFSQSNVIPFDFRQYMRANIAQLCFFYFTYAQARLRWNVFIDNFAKKFEQYCCNYDETISSSLNTYTQKMSADIQYIEQFFRNAVDKVGFNLEKYLKKHYHFFQHEKEFQVRLFNFQLITLADYGFMACIGKSRLIKRNCTLFLGSLHCENIAQELQNIGYQVIFNHINTPDLPLSQEICTNFFAVQPQKTEKSSDLEAFFVKSKL